jgi:tRNA-binding protein
MMQAAQRLVRGLRSSGLRLPMATIQDREKLDVRVGRIVQVDRFPEGKYATHVLLVDLGREIGTMKSVAKLSPNYEGEEVAGRQVLCVVNLPARQIGPHRSEVLTLGVPDKQGNAPEVIPHAGTDPALVIAGKYAFCRQKVEAKAIKTGDPADYSKCDASYS